ncbi:MAG TPA: SRPBCC family protein [Chloroflexota bacterium]|nr:SRPBCC family protein [Chloroflexota bacterium]
MLAKSNPKLAVAVLSDLEVALEREFNAPRHLVFAVFTRAEHLRHWWGLFEGSTMTVCEIDARPGGAWRMVLRGADGNVNGFRGQFREVVPPERVTWTFEWEGLPGHISVETVTFTEQNGRTTMRGVTHFDSIEDRDGMLQSGMETGAEASYQVLDRYLPTIG